MSTPEQPAPIVEPTPPVTAPVPVPAQPGSTVEGGPLPTPAVVPDPTPAPDPVPVVPPSGESVAPTPTTPPAGDPAPVEAPVEAPAPAPVEAPAEVPAETPAPPVETPVGPGLPPVTMQRAVTETGDVTRGRDDSDVLTGQFARITDGPYAGRYAVLVSTTTVGPDGYPVTVLVKTRDDQDEFLTVNYAHLTPAPAGQR